MAEKKTILVTGITGAQGGSVMKHLLRRDKFAVRGMTRNPESARARELAKQGVDIVAGDMEDVNSMAVAMDGCWGVFGVTNFWEHFQREYELGRNLVQAVADVKPEFFIFSSLPNPRKMGRGEYDVPHFELKGKLEDEIRELPVRSAFAHVAFYYENFVTFSLLQRADDGSLFFGFPQGDTKLAAVGTEDIGGVVAPMFERPDEFAGRKVGVVGDDRTPAEYAEVLGRVLNARVQYKHIPREEYARLPFPGAEELANMFDMNRVYIKERTAELEESRKLYPEMRDFGTWVKDNKGFFAPVLTPVK